MDSYNIVWFRHGLRLHDNPALIEALKSDSPNEVLHLIPVFIFDGESGGTKVVGFNRMKYLIDSLDDLNTQFRMLGGQLYIFNGDPIAIFRRLCQEFNVKKLCFEQDCEPIWRTRDNRVKVMCEEIGVECIEKVGHTLWDPKRVMDANGGFAPLTYQMFLHTVDTIGQPPRPLDSPDWDGIKIGKLSQMVYRELNGFEQFPTPEDFDLYYDDNCQMSAYRWRGGEGEALSLLKTRLTVEEKAFREGSYMPNQVAPDLINSPTSMSAALRFGCLSVRKFYWDIHDTYKRVQKENGGLKRPNGPHITGQLIWREYFYTMSVDNPYYAEMDKNPICLNISWRESLDGSFERWRDGKTGFPLIDAAMRQLLAEGWIHHTLRNAVATFLTRGALWISWERGLEHFLKYLIDADWSVCAGNWMWVSSSAFEQLLDSSFCTSPILLGKRLDPNGDYVRRYIPELKYYPNKYIHEPCKAPMEDQQEYGCIIGVHYPQPMLDFNEVSTNNRRAMNSIREAILAKDLTQPEHCRPSDESEIRQFFWLSEIAWDIK